MKQNSNNEINQDLPNKENENGVPINQEPGSENAKEPTEEAAPTQEENTNTDNSDDTENGEQLNAEELAAENTKLKKENAVLKLNISEEFREDAVLLADSMVNSECDFIQALNKVVEKYPQFVKAENKGPILNLGGPTQGMKSRIPKERDAFVSGVKNNFLGG